MQRNQHQTPPLRRHATYRWILFGVVLVSVAMVLARSRSTSFETIIIRVGGVPLTVEVANHPAARARGLQGREALADNAGMLFVYPQAKRLRFWMKNTPIDLDIGFFDDEGLLLEVLSMTALHERPHYVSRAPAKYALEVNRGWFAANRISEHSRLELPSPLAAW
ncbi:MAG: DUF192 domain-containing protein [Chromatiaceae bacterium]|jgi:hypothetical protein